MRPNLSVNTDAPSAALCAVRKGSFDSVRDATGLLVKVVGAVSSLEMPRTNVC
jgi:hypothetical protein